MKRVLVHFGIFLIVLAIIGNYLIDALKPSPYFPKPSLVLSALGELLVDKSFLVNYITSIWRIIMGFFLACFMGVGFGFLIGTNKNLQKILEPVIEFFRPLPISAIIPLAIIFWGIGHPMKIFIIVFASLWPIMTSTIKAARDAEEFFTDLIKTFDIRGVGKYLGIILPACYPQIFAGLRISLPIAVIGSILAEMVGQADGIGANMILFQRTFQIEKMYATLLLVALLSYFLNSVLVYFQNKLLLWRGYHSNYNLTKSRNC